jgi:hypothetical protein
VSFARKPPGMRDTTQWTGPTRSWLRSMILLWSVGVVGLVPSRLCAQELSDDWQFGLAIYGWLPDIGGNTTLPIGSTSIDIDSSTILDHVNMTGMGAFAIQKGRWGGITDIVYLDVGESRSQTRHLEIGGNPLPAGVTANAEFDLKAVIWTFAGSYRVAASEASTFDLLIGARLASLKQELEWEFTGNFGPIVPPPRTGTRDASIDQWDGIVGAKGAFMLGNKHNWLVPYYVDVGTGDSDVTWQAEIGIGYRFGWGDIAAVWRHLDYDLKSNGPIEDMNFSGPAVGAMFRW